jgi:diguanylate cyclase (GGDEF)-like protein
MHLKNKNILKYSFIILLGIYAFILGMVYIQFKSYAISQNQEKLQDILMHDKALQKYIENKIKPVIYDFQKRDILPKSYFNPTILSFTYISRHVMTNYNKLRKEHGLEPIIYKIASDNPRNSINKASGEELKILKEFNRQIVPTYKKFFMINGNPYAYYAIPVTKTKKSCLRCHSDPKIAPKDLVKQYGNKAGFHEKLGHIRAILSIKMPLKRELANANHLFIIFAVVLSIIFVLVYLMIYYFVKKIDLKDEKLIDQMNHDPLTGIYNRYKFNEDIKKYLHSKREESVFMIMFDIDHFKDINDTFGHPVGDRVLKELSNLIEKSIRPGDKFYRVGGEEFVIISTNITDTQAFLFAEKLRKTVRDRNFANGIHITVSIGLTKLKKGEEQEVFYKRVDDALYKAKQTGRNRSIKY